ncbi:hypothetical protein F4823DRAFT_562800 [Ustulina deusta]|nr:hypothetical protein F4823DRAFT_562800 [Ustulina deusta]
MLDAGSSSTTTSMTLSTPPSRLRRKTSRLSSRASELPHCPLCGMLLRPGVVRFGEELDGATLGEIRAWFNEGKVNLLLVVGTAVKVWPAAGFMVQARKQRGRARGRQYGREQPGHGEGFEIQ